MTIIITLICQILRFQKYVHVFDRTSTNEDAGVYNLLMLITNSYYYKYIIHHLLLLLLIVTVNLSFSKTKINIRVKNNIA